MVVVIQSNRKESWPLPITLWLQNEQDKYLKNLVYRVLKQLLLKQSEKTWGTSETGAQ